MTRTQIQLPDPLYHQLKRIAAEQDWSLAEVIRRAGEIYVTRYPQRKATAWKLPEPQALGELLQPLEGYRAEAEAIEHRAQV